MQFPTITQSVEDRRERFLERVKALLEHAQRHRQYEGAFRAHASNYAELHWKARNKAKKDEYYEAYNSNQSLAEENERKAFELTTKALELITLLSYETDQFPSQS